MGSPLSPAPMGRRNPCVCGCVRCRAAPAPTRGVYLGRGADLAQRGQSVVELETTPRPTPASAGVRRREGEADFGFVCVCVCDLKGYIAQAEPSM